MDDLEFLYDDDYTLSLEDQEFLNEPNGRGVRAPEKRLDSPITDGLLTRLREYMLMGIAKDEEIIANSPNSNTHYFPPWTDHIKNNPDLNFSGITRPLSQLQLIFKDIKEVPKVIESHMYPTLLQFHDNPPNNFLDHDIDRTTRIYEKVVEAYMEWIQDILPKKELTAVKNKISLKASQISDRSILSGKISQFWSRVVDRYRNAFATHSDFKHHKVEHFDMYCARGFAVIRLTKWSNDWWLITYEQLQMIQDAALARHNTLVALDMGLHNGTKKLREQVLKLLAWHDFCISTHGNDGYTLIKAPEALYKTWINSLSEGDILEYTSFDRTVEKIREKEKTLPGPKVCVDRIISIIHECDNINDAAELFGLIKLSGHPTVYAEKSAKAVRSAALFRDASSPLAVLQITRAVKHIILSTYISKKDGAWPPFDTEPAYDTALRRHYLNRVTSLPLNSYPMSDLDLVEFEKFIEFDYSEDFLKFLDDKAICPGASEIWKFWWPGDQKEPRRLLLKALSTKKIDMRELVERLRKGQTTREEEVVELTQKERELKDAARCFCKLPFLIRCFFTLTEYNLGEYLMADYMPQQTMTMTDSQTKTRLFNMAFKTKKQTRKRAVLELDYSTWNSRMRKHMVNSVARIAERCFGLPGVFSQFHSFCARSTIILTDKHSLPSGAKPKTSVHDWPESELVWRNHYGGFEGIQQKLWTMCTVGLIYFCVWDTDIVFIMAGQGDNQVLVLECSEYMDLRHVIVDLLAKLEVRSKLVNQLVKPEECIDSSTVLTYSKEIFVKGVHIQYSLKFLSRTMAIHDSDIPSFAAEVSSVSSTSVAVANTLPCPIMSYWWQLFRTVRLMREHARFSENPSVTHHLQYILAHDGLLQFALVLPGSLGGLPSMTWGRFLIRGEVDELSWDLAAILRLKNMSTVHKDLALVLDKRYTPSDPDINSLLMDPMSIPLNRPRDQTRIIREHLEKGIGSLTKNSWIKEILVSNTGASGDGLAKIAVKTQPFYPQIMSDILSHSLAGLRLDILGRFTMTRTVASALGGIRFAHEISQSSAQLLGWIRLRYRDAYESQRTLPYCPKDTFILANKLRSYWKTSDKDSICTVHVPLAAKLTKEIISLPCIAATTRTTLSQINSSVGDYPPNFGTATRQKRSEHGYKIITSSDTVKSLKHLVLTASQIGATSGARELIDNIIRSRSPWSLDVLEQIFPTVYGGVAAHRHDALRKKHFGVLGSSTIPSHICLSSDNSGQLAGGKDDYPYVFQQDYLCLTNLVQVFARSNPESEIRVSIGICLPTMEPLPSEPVTAKTHILPRWNVSVDNKLAYANEIRSSVLAERPPESLIPTRKRRGRDSIILASYLLTKINPSTHSVMTAYQGILSPIEILDIAEINGMTTHDIMLGIGIYTAIETAYQIIRSGLSYQHIVKNTVIGTIASQVVPLVLRSMLTPGSHHRVQLQDMGVLPTMGHLSTIKASKIFTGKIVALARQMLISNYIVSLPDPLILFADTSSAGLTVLKKLAGFMLLQPLTADADALRIPHNSRQQLLNSFYVPKYTKFASQYVSTGIYMIRRIMYLLASHHSPLVQEKAETILSNWPHVVWDKRDADEARRDLRQGTPLNINPNLLEFKRLRKNHSPVIFSITTVTVGSSLFPTSASYEINQYYRAKELILRPIGLYTTALSTWLAYFRIDQLASHTTVINIGVGNGAIAEALIYNGVQNVIGIDLHDALPMISQREISFIPPEITQVKKFRWADEVFGEYGGDITRINIDTLTTRYCSRLIVIDIETEPELVIESIREIKNTAVVWRTRLSSDQLRWIISASPPDDVIRTSEESTNEVSMYIIYWSNINGLPLTASPSSVTIHFNPITYPLLATGKFWAKKRLSRIYGQYGFSEMDLNKATMDRIINELRRRLTNNQHITADEYHGVLTLSTLVRELMDYPPETVVNSIATIPEVYVRDVCYILANYWPDLTDYLEV